VNQADAVTELFDFEPLIAADDLHGAVSFRRKKTSVATDATLVEESIKSLYSA
jgi:hypothetical protein